MTQVRTIQEQVKIVVALDPSLEHFADPAQIEAQTFKNRLLQYIDELSTDLALPAQKLLLEVKRVEDASQLVLGSYRVQINDEDCKFARPAYLMQSANSLDMAQAVAGAIYQNRELFITASLSQQIRQQWLTEKSKAPLTELSPTEFHRLLLAFVRRGFNIERASSSARAIEAHASWRAEYAFEESVANWDVISMAVFFSASQYAGMVSSDESQKQQFTTPGEQVKAMFEEIRNTLFQALGVIIPQVNILADETLVDNTFRLQCNDLRFPPAEMLAGEQDIVNDATKGLLSYTIWMNAGSFLVTDAVKYMLSMLSQQYAALVETASARFDIATLTRILRDLLDEGISIKDLRSILEALVAINDVSDLDVNRYLLLAPPTASVCLTIEEKTLEDLDVVDYTNHLRIALRRYTTARYTQSDNTLYVYLVPPQVGARIRNIDEYPLAEDEYGQLLRTIYNDLEKVSANVYPVVLANIDVRKKLRDLLAREFPWLTIMSYWEVSADTPIAQLTPISLKPLE